LERFVLALARIPTILMRAVERNSNRLTSNERRSPCAGQGCFSIMAAIGTLACLLSARPAAAQWQPNGVPICVADGNQGIPDIVSDGAGGAIIIWYKEVKADFSTSGIFAQRVNAAGIPQWAPEGVFLVTEVSFFPARPGIVSDDAGGAIVIWRDYRAGVTTVYAQRLSAAGILHWTPSGAAICTSEGLSLQHTVVADGAGGAIVAWNDGRRGPLNPDIYVQRVDAAGVAQWGTDGIAICAAASFQGSPTIVSDGAGGAIIAWTDARPGSSECDIYGQRVNAAGVTEWAPDGVPLCTALKCQREAAIAADGAGGAIVTWQDSREYLSDIYAQRVSAAGVPQWATDGISLSTGAELLNGAAIMPDGTGGAIVTWEDQRTRNADIHAQRVNAVGVPQWTADGLAVCTATGQQRAPTLVSDGAGGAIITWFDWRSFYSIYAQRVGATGALQWAVDGVALCAGPGAGGGPVPVSDGAGGAIVAWGDLREGYDRWDRARGDIYAQRVTSDGTTVPPPAPPRIAASAETLAAALAPALAPRAVTATKRLRLWNRGGSAWTFRAYIDFDYHAALEDRGPATSAGPHANAEVLAGGWFGVGVEPTTGTIAAGDSLDLLVHFDAAHVGDGDYELNLAVAGKNNYMPVARILCRLHVGLLDLELEVRPDRLRADTGREREPRERHDVEQARAGGDRQVRARLLLPPGVHPRAVVPGSVRLQRVLGPLEAKDDVEYGDEQDDASTIIVAESMRGRVEEGERRRDMQRSRRVQFCFDRAALLALLPESGKAAVELTGELEGISWFAGVDSVEVVAHPRGMAGEAVAAPALHALPQRDGLRLLTRNPVSGPARLELSLTAPAAVRVRVYDLGGALVRELARGDLDAGHHRLIWDGRTASGAAVPSGIYFVGLERARERVALRVVLTR
jgi:flagellar hook capping protein FlgD